MKTYLPKLHPKSSFQMEKSCNQFSVTYQSALGDKESKVIFCLNKEDIQAKVQQHGCPAQTYTLQPAWHRKEERCVLLFDDAPLEMWEVSKRVLEPLFFQEK